MDRRRAGAALSRLRLRYYFRGVVVDVAGAHLRRVRVRRCVVDCFVTFVDVFAQRQLAIKYFDFQMVPNGRVYE